MNSEKSIDKLKRNVAVMLCALGMVACFAVCWFQYYKEQMITPYYRAGDYFVFFLFSAVFFFCASIYGIHRISISRVSELIYSEVLSFVIADFIMYIVIVLLCGGFPNPIPLLLAAAMQFFTAMVWALAVHKWYFMTHPAKRTVIVWDVRDGIDNLLDMYGLRKRYRVVAQVRADECLEDLDACLEGAEAVFLWGVHSHDRNVIIKYCVRNNIDSYVIPRVGDTIMESAKPVHLFHLPVVKLERYSPNFSYLLLKRIGDVLVSGTALIVLSPLMLVVGIIIKMTDGGTVFYRQLRLTKDGKEFYVLKFRSMRMDAEKDGVARLSTGSADDRITPIGRVIRAVRIDELPQLFNILKGEMSIVGPRPERPEIAAQYEKEMPEFGLRLQAKAGLTGYAQVYGRYNTTPYDKLLMDLSYIANPSIAEDFKICMATVKILFMAESTEGVAVGSTTALNDVTYRKEEEDKEHNLSAYTG